MSETNVKENNSSTTEKPFKNAKSELLRFIENKIKDESIVVRKQETVRLDNERRYSQSDMDSESKEMPLVDLEEAIEVHIDPLEILSTSHTSEMPKSEGPEEVYVKEELVTSDIDEDPSVSNKVEAEAYPSCSSEAIEPFGICKQDSIGKTVLGSYAEDAVLTYQMLLQQTLNTNPDRSKGGMKLLHCSFCDYSTYEITSLKRHNHSHSDEKPLECSQCSYKTNRKPSLKRHSLSHIESKAFSCIHCSFSTKLKRNLARHMLNHSSVKKLICPLCPYATNNRAHHRRHVQAHLDKHIKCPHCDYRTHRKDHLQRHLVKHSNPLPLRCHVCNYVTIFKREMNMHMLRHNIKKTFACEQCPYQTDIKYHYHRHIWIHLNKRYHCVLCEYKTNRSDCLKSHLMAKHYETFQTDEDAEEYLSTTEASNYASLEDDVKSVSLDDLENSKDVDDNSVPSIQETEYVKLKNRKYRKNFPFAGNLFLSHYNDISDNLQSEPHSTRNERSLSHLFDNELFDDDTSNDNKSSYNNFTAEKSANSCQLSVVDPTDSKSSGSTTVPTPDNEELLYLKYLANRLSNVVSSNRNTDGSDVSD